ncbi:mitogen-activated protein kinase kinase kinase [Malassezia brasiliensis]|uniref:Mitogen-activated protein kinase kinase kinase n=1 Tax=Malassezia brasiliensis TaxID=1821822 RepID=A0AAF0DVP0_9BASI|nr:mitogen-activated protein kinase kinase kinase [Malassezia brasiliensis]
MPANVRNWSVPEVLAWLHECHLGQHAPVFADNDIQGTALLELDQAALKEMGLASMGDRLRILAAIRALNKRNQEALMRASPSRTHGAYPRGRSAHDRFATTSDSESRQASPASSVHTPVPLSSSSLHTQHTHNHYLTPLARVSDLDLGAGAVPRSLQRRPNTATGVSTGAWQSAASVTSPTSPTSAVSLRSRRPATATSSSSQNVGYSVGRGAFAPSHAAKSRTMQISAPYNLRRADSESDSESARGEPAVSPAFKNLRRALIKFYACDGTSRVVDVSECTSAQEVLVRVLRKFSVSKSDVELEAATYMSPFAFAMAGTDGKLKMLSENELMAVCSAPHAYMPVWQNGLYLVHNGKPLPDAVAVQSPASVTRRASTQSILLGLGVENVAPETSPSPSRTSFARRAARPAVAVAVAATEPLRPTTRVKRRVRNFFGQRPPSELISSHLSEYFPATDSRELQRHSRASLGDVLPPSSAQPDAARLPSPAADGARASPPLRRFPSRSAARVSTASPRGSAQSNASAADDEASSLITMDEITQDLDERNSSDSHGDGTMIVDQDGVPIPLTSPRAREASTTSLVERSATPPDAAATAADAEPSPGEGAVTKPRMRWHKGALIGAGSFGKVFLGMNAKTGLLMAVKQVELPTSDEAATQRRRYMIESLEAEIALLKTIEHPNIVHYLDSYADGEFLNIFLEYVPGGSVVALLRSYGAFEEQLVQNFVRQILQGLHFLHSQAIVHRDIKGANILVDNKGGVKISDFGISKKVESGLLVSARGQRGMLQGSVFWMAPEVVKQTSHTPKADVWSVGCLIVEMLTATHPWPKLDQMQALFQIGMSRRPEIPPDISAAATDFLLRTFEVDEAQRPSAGALLDHVFITQSVSEDAAKAD